MLNKGSIAVEIAQLNNLHELYLGGNKLSGNHSVISKAGAYDHEFREYPS